MTIQTITLPISEVPFALMRTAAKTNDIEGWIYPRRDTSKFIPLMTRPQQAALGFYLWIGILMLPAGIVLSLVFWNWYWLLLLPLAIALLKANRRSVDQFFLENLRDRRDFYEAVANSGLDVSVVIKGPRPEREHEG